MLDFLAQEKQTQYILLGLSRLPKLWAKYGEKSSGGTNMAFTIPNNSDPSFFLSVPSDGWIVVISSI